MADPRGFAVVPRSVALAGEARLIREQAAARYAEVDLLVAALREHVDDLRGERDRLVAENHQLRDALAAARAESAAAGARWLVSRQKPPRGSQPER